MRFEHRTFWLAKDAQYPDEYQDAFALAPDRGLAAIADGVSSAIFSAAWARILTEAVIAEPPRLDDGAAFVEWLARRRAAWSQGIDARSLPWNVRPKMVLGAMTTLLWVELTPPDAADGFPGWYRLRCTAIGDCCLFHVRKGDQLRSFPMDRAESFGLDPCVVGSIDRKQDHLLEFHLIDDACWPGDLLVLATDALAQWAVGRHESGQPVAWENYWDLSPEAFFDEIMALRNENQIRYDDTTLMLLRVVDESLFPAAAPPPVVESAVEILPAFEEEPVVVEPAVLESAETPMVLVPEEVAAGVEPIVAEVVVEATASGGQRTESPSPLPEEPAEAVLLEPMGNEERAERHTQDRL